MISTRRPLHANLADFNGNSVCSFPVALNQGDIFFNNIVDPGVIHFLKCPNRVYKVAHFRLNQAGCLSRWCTCIRSNTPRPFSQFVEGLLFWRQAYNICCLCLLTVVVTNHLRKLIWCHGFTESFRVLTAERIALVFFQQEAEYKCGQVAWCKTICCLQKFTDFINRNSAVFTEGFVNQLVHRSLDDRDRLFFEFLVTPVSIPVPNLAQNSFFAASNQTFDIRKAKAIFCNLFGLCVF